MERFIGLDTHSASCTFAVVGPSGKRLQSQVVETNGKALVEFVKTVPRKRRLCMEEGTQSQWLHEILSPHVDEIVVAGVGRSRGNKSDCSDAFGLAEALRVGSIKTRVFKGGRELQKLRELARVYQMVTGDVTRAQSRLKSVYRSRGIQTPGARVYGTREREVWIARLDPARAAAARTLYAQYDAGVGIKKACQQELLAEAGKHAMWRLLRTAPGFGPLRAAQLLPVVVTPHRFRTSRQFWSYCGFGVVMRSSSDWVKQQRGWVRAEVSRTRGLNRNYNSILKNIFKGAATTVINQLRESALAQDYRRQLDAGTKPNLAKLTLARRIAATVLAMWKHEEVYDPNRSARTTA